MRECCKRHLEFLREEQGVSIFECVICKSKFAVYQTEGKHEV